MIALLVVGNLIGAGILALPIQTGGAGLIFSLVAMALCCGAMYFSAVTLAREAVEAKSERFNYPTLYHRYLGSAGKWVAVITNLFILYGLLTAYLCGGTAIILSVLGVTAHKALWQLVTVLCLFTGLSAFTMGGTKIIARYNGLLMIVLAASFAAIVAMGATHIQVKRELFFNLQFLPIAVPVILTAFHFHNIIPSISTHLGWNLKAIKMSMGIGMAIGFLMNLIWVAVGIGVLPLVVGKYNIVYAFTHGLPATVPISEILKNPLFSFFATLFAIVAICTSYIANGMGLLDFNRDLLTHSLGRSGKIGTVLLTFLPPLGIAIFFPDIFLKMIGIVGGIGIAVLFGVLPSIVYFKKTRLTRKKVLALTMLILFAAALCCDLLNDVGIINTSRETATLETKVPQRQK